MDDTEDTREDEGRGLRDDIDPDDLGDELGVGESELSDDDGVIFDSGEEEDE